MIKLKLYISALILLISQILVAQTIETYAGTGVNTSSTDGQLATASSMHYPFDVEVDADRNVYWADVQSYRIRKIDWDTKIVTTIIGTGSNTYNGDNSGTTTNVDGAHYFDITPNGDIYFTELTGQRIRKYDASTGQVTTILGNGTSGYTADMNNPVDISISNPAGIVVAPNGDIYYSESGNSIIRKFTTSNQLITISGTQGVDTYYGENVQPGQATFGYATDLALDSQGNLYISDIYGKRVRKIDFGQNLIYSVAGNGTDTYAGGGPGTSNGISYCEGIAIDNNDDLFISSQNHQIYKVEASTGDISVFCGTGTGGYSGDGGNPLDAEIFTPTGIGIDPFGNLFFSDLDNFRMRNINICNPPSVPTIYYENEGVEICAGETFHLYIVSGDLNDAQDWYWFVNQCGGTDNFGIGGDIVGSVDSTTTFYLRGDGGNCDADSCASITIAIKECEERPGNVITPNGDGTNDYFHIDQADGGTNNAFWVVNRWGDVVFKTTNYDNALNFWEGQSESGEALESGTYYYLFEIDNVAVAKGWVQILR